MPQHLNTPASSHPTPATHVSWLAHLIPGMQEARSLDALATGMSGLALRKQAVALEMAATATSEGVRRRFLIRAQTPQGGAHLRAQLLARYPQASVRPLDATHDPLRRASTEAVSCVELRLGAPAYLPLRTWNPKRMEEAGSDPLLGVLAALKTLSPRHRAVAQLVLTPAPATWSRQAQRFAQEHPLEEARFQRQLLARARTRSAATIEHEFFLEILAILLVLVALGSWLWQPIQHVLPAWLTQAGAQLLQGQMPPLSAGEIMQLSLGFVALLTLLAGLGWLLATARNRLTGAWRAPRIYDPALVRQKTERIAYRAALRLYVLGPQPHLQPPADTQDQRVQDLARRYRHAWRTMGWRHGFRRATWKRAIARGKHALLAAEAWIEARLRALQVLATASWWRTRPAHLQQHAQHAHASCAARLALWRRRWQASRERRATLEHLVAAYQAYHLASGNFFVPRWQSRWRAARRLTRLAHTARALRRIGWRPAYLTPEEVASLYHLLDQADLRDLAFVEHGGARTRPVPWQLARPQQDHQQPFGENQHQGERTPVFFPPDILQVNLLALAGTGKGKSSLFAHLARELFASPIRHGVVLVDPHGDLALTFLGSVPRARRDEVIYLNLADFANPPGLNYLDLSAGQDRDKTVDMLLSIFRTWWGGPGEHKAWGPRLENTLQYCLLTLCEVNRRRCLADPQHGPQRQCSILSVVPLLQRPYYQKALLGEIRDEDIWNWWKGYFAQQEDEEQRQIAASVITRLSKFRASTVIRRIVGQPASSFSLSDIVTNGRILIVNAASGIVGEDTSTLLGSVLLGLLQTSIAEQAKRPEEQRTPIYVFLDEMQKFLGIDLNAMTAELRKYGAHFAFATQSFGYLDALDRTLTHTLLANADQLFAFDMSAQDATRMVHEIGDGLEAEDILLLDNYACYARLSQHGARLPAFSLRLLPPPAGDPVVVAALQEQSARRYGRPVAAVDAQLRRQDRAGEQKRGPAPPHATPSPDEDDGLSPDFDRIDRDAQARQWPDAEEEAP